MGFRQWMSKWATRASLENPANSLSDPNNWYPSYNVVPFVSTPESACTITAVYAAVNLIASTVASLPLHVYKYTADGKERDTTTPLHALLHTRPNPYMSSYVYRHTMVAQLLLFGAHYSEIERDNQGNPIALWPIYPTDISIQIRNGQWVFVWRGGLQTLMPEDVIYIPGLSLDGCTGLVPTALAQDTLELSKNMERFGASFFKNGATPSGIIQTPQALGPDSIKNLRDSWNADVGGPDNAQKVKVLEQGAQYIATTLAPEHAQFLESRKFSIGDIARLFNLPSSLIGDLEHAHFANMEQQALQYVTTCISPLVTKIEQELTWKLGLNPTHFAEFNLSGMLRGDSTARSQYYTQALTNGWLSVNEVRAMENLNRIPGGDTYRAPLNLGPIGEPTNE